MIPSSVTSIGDSAFSACNELISVTIKSANPPILCDSAFNARNTNLILYVPSKSVEPYKEAEGWDFAGWFTEESCTDGNEYDFSTTVTEDMTLHAKWVEKSTPTPDPGKDDPRRYHP